MPESREIPPPPDLELPVVEQSEREAPHIEGERMYDAVVEWLDLNRELKEAGSETWKDVRTQKKSHDIPITKQAKAIEEGRIDTLFADTIEEKDIKTERNDYLRERLSELDKEIGTGKQRGDVREEVRNQFRVDRQMQKVGAELDSLEIYVDRLNKKEFALLREHGGSLTSADQRLLEDISHLRYTIEQRRETLELGGETGLAVRRHELRRYHEQLSGDRFAETPSRRVYLEKIQKLWEEGQNVLVTGPTGTGKTELLIHLTQKLYGEGPEVVRCSDRVGAAEIFGKTLLKAGPDGGTATYFQPGRYVVAIDKGKPIVFDEFNLLDPKVRLQLKELYNRKAGDAVTIQEDTGERHTIQEGFGFAATANIKSEKHKERFELDAAESRVFHMEFIDYLPKEELYDLCLAKLSDARGYLPLLPEDANETLKHLVEAVEIVQQAYLGEQTAFYEPGGGTKKKHAKLEKAVLDQGAVLSMLDGWAVARARGDNFGDYLGRQILAFANKEDYPSKDNHLVTKIFASKGFLQGANIYDAKLKKEMEDLGWSATPRVNKDLTRSLRPDEVARLDPFEVRQKMLAEIGQEFLGQAPHAERSNLEASGLERELNVREQYDKQVTLLRQHQFLEQLSSGVEGIHGIDSQEYPLPTYEQVMEKLAEKKELMETKVGQGFKRLVIVPIGVPLSYFKNKYATALMEHARNSMLFRAKKNPNDQTEFINNFDVSTPVWQWDEYEDADINGKLQYGVQTFDQSHGGKSKSEMLAAEGGWQVLLVEERPDIPRAGEAEELGGRSQLEAGKTPNEYLKILQDAATDPQSPYYGEQGLTPETWLTVALANLEEKNEVTDDYDGRGSVAYNVGAYFPASGNVPHAFWYRGIGQADLDGDAPGLRDGRYGVRPAVRIL